MIINPAGNNETILINLARKGIILSAPCGGRKHCGKCKVRLVSGQVSGDIPDEQSMVRACKAIPSSEIEIECIDNFTVLSSELEVTESAALPDIVRAGVAIDIGTTTVSAKLINLETLSTLEIISLLNDQKLYGADIMSRIAAAMEGKTVELHKLINNQTEEILKSFKQKWNLKNIERLIVSGNTCMLHLFLNIDPAGMGAIPFQAVFLDEKELQGEKLGLSADKVIMLPAISAFIGADIAGGLAALDILSEPEPSLYIDIGTNGEMALYNKEIIFCCSAAVGPAFEGAEISCGMHAISGAISAVELARENRLEITTIGNTSPRGICGSGLIDTIAVMLRQGIIDETGYMEDYPEGYPLAQGVTITGRDIRQFQLAKSAVFSGIKILCKNAGLALTEIKNVYIAGGFGFFINKKNAVDTGLLPKEFVDCIIILGNMSLRGAEELLASELFIEKCREITKKCTVIDLSVDPKFMDEFSENMGF
ncbi:MAG: ASKHA domain-containing protein [Treponema sp.]|nr:ASKHA domain-containing protein [Treponema sp.]